MKNHSKEIFLLHNTPYSVMVTHAFAQESISDIVQHIQYKEDTNLPKYTIFIHRIEDLHTFVQHIPELAWEMLEYAEEPLEIIYPKKKYNTTFDDLEGISVRLVKQTKLNLFVRKHGPLITFPFENNISTPAAFIKEELNFADKNDTYKVVKTMKLFTDGTFTFLR